MALLSYDTSKPWRKYFNSQMAKLPSHVQDAVSHGLRPAELFNEDLNAECYSPIETGYSLSNGEMLVNVLTDMPGVSPSDWSWWFGWHGDDSSKYKLWHPLAHQMVAWNRPGDGYIGRTSYVSEYLGLESTKLTVSFVEPRELGMKDNDGTISICARVGVQGMPFNTGTLIHPIRKTETGCEMRSRFCVGGDYIDSTIGRFLSRNIRPTTEQMARSLLVHCAEEMNHLVGFLKDLRDEFGSSS